MAVAPAMTAGMNYRMTKKKAILELTEEQLLVLGESLEIALDTEKKCGDDAERIALLESIGDAFVQAIRNLNG